MSVDRLATHLQENGHVALAGQPLSELLAACDALGIDPATVQVNGTARVATTTRTTTARVALAEAPTRIMGTLMHQPRTFDELRADLGVEASDLDLLIDLDFVEADAAGSWHLTGDGRAAIRPRIVDASDES